MFKVFPIILWISALYTFKCVEFAHSAFVQRRVTTEVIPRSFSSQLHLKKGGTKKKKVKGKTITLNKLAYRNYEVVETLEVGVALRGTEVKRCV